jgi:hypothetical protein
VAAAVLACAAMLAVAGSAGVASASTRSRTAMVAGHSATAHPASTAGFLIHAGLAFYVFDHYIYRPFKAGDLTHGFTHKLKLIEATAAALFVYHELTLAISDVKGSKLAFLAVPITALAAKLASLKSALGDGNTSAVSGINGSLGTIGQQAAGKGFTIKPIVHSVA